MVRCGVAVPALNSWNSAASEPPSGPSTVADKPTWVLPIRPPVQAVAGSVASAETVGGTATVVWRVALFGSKRFQAEVSFSSAA